MLKDFQKLLGQIFDVSANQVLGRWEIPFAEVVRIVGEDALPKQLVEFPVQFRCLERWEAIYLFTERYADDKSVRAIVQPIQNKAAYELILMRRVQTTEAGAA